MSTLVVVMRSCSILICVKLYCTLLHSDPPAYSFLPNQPITVDVWCRNYLILFIISYREVVLDIIRMKWLYAVPMNTVQVVMQILCKCKSEWEN